MLREDARIVSLLRDEKTREKAPFRFDPSRPVLGVFYVHVGLVREASASFSGPRWKEYIRSKYASAEGYPVGDDPVEDEDGRK